MENENSIVLIDEDGKEVEFEHLDTIETEDGSVYVVLYPVEEIESEDVFIFKVVTDEEGNEQLEAIEDDDELMQVFDIFKSRMEEEYEFLEE